MAWFLSVLAVAAWLTVFVVIPTVIIFRRCPDTEDKILTALFTVLFLNIGIIILLALIAAAHAFINPYFN